MFSGRAKFLKNRILPSFVRAGLGRDEVILEYMMADLIFQIFPFLFLFGVFVSFERKWGALSVILPCGSIPVCLRHFDTQQMLSSAVSMC
jgi:hypothetical protein